MLCPPRRPLLVFNLVDAVDGDGRLAPMVPARLDALGLPYTGGSTSAWLDTLSKIGTKLKLAHAGLPTPAWSEDGGGSRPRRAASSSSRCGSMARSASTMPRCMRGADAARAIAERNLRWKTEHFAEGYLDGREFNLALLEGPSGPSVLPIGEIVFEGFERARADDRRLRRQMDAGQPAPISARRAASVLEPENPELAAKLRDARARLLGPVRAVGLCARRFPRRCATASRSFSK